MDEILPGIHHWTSHDEELGTPVSSSYVDPAGVLIDPTVPDEGLDPFAGLMTPQQAVLTNRRHVRESARFREASGCVVRAPAAARDELAALDVRPYWPGDEVGPGVIAVEIDVIAEDEAALHITHGGGAIAFGDAIVRPGGVLGFPATKRSARIRGASARASRRRRDFDALLVAHGEPLRDDGKRALRQFVEVPVEYPEYGPYA
jgi:hypothetical protein